MKKLARGFTLIELIVVILILGILAAVAAPKFANLTGAARAAALDGLRASVISAATLANALQVAQGLASNASVTIETSTIAMSNGYPTAAVGGIDLAVRYDTTVFSTAGAFAYFVTAAADTANCRFTYTAATTTVPASTAAILDRTKC